MQIIGVAGSDELAKVYLARTKSGQLIEFVESLQPPLPREKKWVLIVSTMYGCPVRCLFCDAGGEYKGKLSADDILGQIEFMVKARYGSTAVPADMLKIQFARMGEPTLNNNLLEALGQLPDRIRAPGLLPSISTVAPIKAMPFLERLLEIKNRLYPGRFQFQFSIHTTDPGRRAELIPTPTLSLAEMADFGRRWKNSEDRKVALNFALAEGSPVDVDLLSKHFDPDIFIIKITPLNPTYRASENQLKSFINPHRVDSQYELIDKLKAASFEVLVSIGEVDENLIGSNCGQLVVRHMQNEKELADGYTSRIEMKPDPEGESCARAGNQIRP
ncbi:MAG: radical SAM protein [candidate division Zixibacteria bacterium]